MKLKSVRGTLFVCSFVCKPPVCFRPSATSTALSSFFVALPAWAGRATIGHSEYDPVFKDHRSWNAGCKLGAKRGRKPQQVWATRFWLDREQRLRDRAMFDLAVDSKLHGCDLLRLWIGEIVSGARVRTRAIVVQRKTGRPVQFELFEPVSTDILAWLECPGKELDDYAFPSRIARKDNISTRQNAHLNPTA